MNTPRPVAIVYRLTRRSTIRQRIGAMVQRVGLRRIGRRISGFWSPYDQEGRVRPDLHSIKRSDLR